MNNKIIKKFLFVLLIIALMEVLLINLKAEAICNEVIVSREEDLLIEESIENAEEGTIMKIDSTTGEVSEVDIDTNEVAQVLDTMQETGNYSTSLIAPNNVSTKNEVPALFGNLSLASNTKVVCLNAPEVAYQRIICKIISDSGSGTGYLIGDKYLLTAGHCVLQSAGVAADNWVAYPGYQNYTALAAMGWNTIYYDSNYVASGSTDWAIVELDDDYGSSIGWMYVTLYYNYSDMQGLSVTSWGYSDDTYDAQWLCYSRGSITSAYSGYFNASCSVYCGMSGGPVRISDNTSVGINVAAYTDNDTLKAVRIDDNLFDLIVDLLND